MTRDVLAMIDEAIDDWTVSGDAMRSNVPAVSLVKARPVVRFVLRPPTPEQIDAFCRAMAEIGRQYTEAFRKFAVELNRLAPDLRRLADALARHHVAPKRVEGNQWEMAIASRRGRGTPPGVQLATQQRRKR